MNFDRLGETGFELELSVRDGVVDLARRFRERTTKPPTPTAGLGADGRYSGLFGSGDDE